MPSLTYRPLEALNFPSHTMAEASHTVLPPCRSTDTTEANSLSVPAPVPTISSEARIITQVSLGSKPSPTPRVFSRAPSQSPGTRSTGTTTQSQDGSIAQQTMITVRITNLRRKTNAATMGSPPFSHLLCLPRDTPFSLLGDRLKEAIPGTKLAPQYLLDKRWQSRLTRS